MNVLEKIREFDEQAMAGENSYFSTIAYNGADVAIETFIRCLLIKACSLKNIEEYEDVYYKAGMVGCTENKFIAEIGYVKDDCFIRTGINPYFHAEINLETKECVLKTDIYDIGEITFIAPVWITDMIWSFLEDEQADFCMVYEYREEKADTESPDDSTLDQDFLDFISGESSDPEYFF